MRILIILFSLPFIYTSVFTQNAEYYTNSIFLKMLNSEPSYTQLKGKVVSGYEHSKPGHWGEFVKGEQELIIRG